MDKSRLYELTDQPAVNGLSLYCLICLMMSSMFCIFCLKVLEKLALEVLDFWILSKIDIFTGI